MCIVRIPDLVFERKNKKSSSSLIPITIPWFCSKGNKVWSMYIKYYNSKLTQTVTLPPPIPTETNTDIWEYRRWGPGLWWDSWSGRGRPEQRWKHTGCCPSESWETGHCWGALWGGTEELLRTLIHAGDGGVTKDHSAYIVRLKKFKCPTRVFRFTYKCTYKRVKLNYNHSKNTKPYVF